MDMPTRSRFCMRSYLMQSLQTKAHLDSDVFGATASIDGGVIVQIVPGSIGKVGLCGVRALVHDWRNQQCIACSTEWLLAQPAATLVLRARH